MITSKIFTLVLILCVFLFLIAIKQRNSWFKRIESTRKSREEKDWQLTLNYLEGTFKRTMTFKKELLNVGHTFQWGKKTFVVIDVKEKEKVINITAKEYE